MEKKSVFVHEVYTECEINAPAAKVYSIISDFANFKKWTNDLTVSGYTKQGGKMTVTVNVPNQGRQKLSSKMLRMDQNIISFNNVVTAPFLFLGKHRYEIIPVSENKTRFINAEVFSGLALPILQLKNFTSNVRQFKENCNLALKRTAEA